MFSTPAVGDLDGDGSPEIVATTWNHGVFAWHLNGSLLPGFPRFMYDSLWSSPALRDLDGDGRPEIIFGGDMDNYPGAPYPWGGLLWVLRTDATNYPGFPKSIPRQVVWSSPAVGDVDANGAPDIVFGTGLNFPDDGHHVYALNNGGYSLPGWSSGGAPGINVGSLVMASPVLGNLVNGDARLYTAIVTGDGYTAVLNPDGSKRWTSCDDWTGQCPHYEQHHGSAAIADVNGDGQQDVVSFVGNKLRVFNGNTGAVEAEDHNIDPCCQIRTFAPAAAPTVSRVGSDTWITVHALYDANGNGQRDTGDRDRLMAWKIASVPQGRFDWPTFKQNQRRTGGAIDLTAPTASFSSVPNPSASTKVTVGWTATDGQTVGEDTTGVRSFDVDVQDGAGAWTRWLSGVDPTGGSGTTGDRQLVALSRVNSSTMLSMRYRPPVAGAILDEVVGPHMVRPLRTKPDARAVRQPQPAPFRLLHWNLQPLAPPDAGHPRHAHVPARLVQQSRDPTIAVAAIGACQRDDIGGQPGLVGSSPRRLALRRAVLPERRTGTTLGHLQLSLNVLDACPPARGA